MRYSTQLKPIAQLRRNGTALLKQLKTSDDPIIITQRGYAKAVLMDIVAFEQMEAEKERLLGLLRDQSGSVEASC